VSSSMKKYGGEVGGGSGTQVRQTGGGRVAPVLGGTDVTRYRCCWPGLFSGMPRKYLKRRSEKCLKGASTKIR
jgi:hypothetical protein